jgi:hypothetical protein
MLNVECRPTSPIRICMSARFVIFNLILFLTAIPAFSQNKNTGKVAGFIRDAKTMRPLEFVSVGVLRLQDSAFIAGGISDSTGRFYVAGIPMGTFYLKILYIGYEPYKSVFFSFNSALTQKDFGYIKLKQTGALLKVATIYGKQILFDQVGDTIQYHADAFKTHPDATAEDLISKLPGVTVNNGAVSVNGETVTQVTVDGKPFFGDDPTMAIRNLPAEVIDKIQVFDKQSDQSLFTGFDDGQTTKTINITTKPGKSNGEFGKFYAGYGDDTQNTGSGDDRYIYGGNLNIFDGDRRISILGLANNINQQNFSTQDLLGVTGGGGATKGGGGGGMGSNGNPNFLVGPQNGITTTNAFGLNYSDKWSKDIKITASYFYSEASNQTMTDLSRNYITGTKGGVFYSETDSATNNNYNQRLNIRYEETIDSANSLIITPKVSLQNNTASLGVLGLNTLPGDIPESGTKNNTPAFTAGYDFTNTILLRHKFKKKGRTFSAGLSSDLNNKYGNGSLNSRSLYYSPDDTINLNQQSTIHSNGYMLSPNLVYTEPTDSFGQLQLSYNPSYTFSNIDKESDNYNILNQSFTNLDTALSNKYQSVYFNNKAGIGYRRNKKKYSLMAGVNFQYANLSGSEYFPSAFPVNKNFSDVLPQLTYNYRFTKGTNIRIIYRATTNIPSISQLQSVVNNSNPLFLSMGNTELRQDYEQSVTVRYGKAKREKSSGLFVFFNAMYANNYISNSTLIPTKDTVLSDGVALKKGIQFSQPVNLNGYYTAKTFVTYALPITKIRCNLNLNSGLNYSQSPSLINNFTNLSGSYGMSGGLGLSSNISEKVDFTVVYNVGYSMVKNTLQSTVPNANYVTQTASLKFNWLFLNGWLFNTTLNQSVFQGLTQNYNLNYLLWNAALGYKLLKDHSFEVKASVFDALNQNNNISRTISSSYIEDDKTNVLTRYYMLTLTYTLRKFKGAHIPAAAK